MLLCQLVLELFFLCVHILVLLVGLFASIKACEEARFGVERPPPSCDSIIYLNKAAH